MVASGNKKRDLVTKNIGPSILELSQQIFPSTPLRGLQGQTGSSPFQR